MTMNITPQFIQQVFAEKPHVHRAFVENVPQKMDEKEFWTRFAKHEIQMQVGLYPSLCLPLTPISLSQGNMRSMFLVKRPLGSDSH